MSNHVKGMTSCRPPEDDCISRQAAIEAMADMYHAAEKWGQEATDDVIKARAESCMASLVEMKLRFEKMPSARLEIIKCKDCEWFRKEYGWNCIEYTVCKISPTHHPIRREEDFCSRAERRTDERNRH